MNTAVASTKKSADEGCPSEGVCIRQKHFKKITKAVLSNNAFPAEIARLIAEYAYECPSWGMFFFQGQVPDDVWMLRRRSPYPPMETLTGECRDPFFRPLRWSMQVKWEDPTTVAPTKHPAKERTNAEQGLPTWLVVDCTTDPRALIPRDEYGQSDASDSDGSEKEDTTKEDDDGYDTKRIPESKLTNWMSTSYCLTETTVPVR